MQCISIKEYSYAFIDTGGYLYASLPPNHVTLTSSALVYSLTVTSLAEFKRRSEQPHFLSFSAYVNVASGSQFYVWELDNSSSAKLSLTLNGKMFIYAYIFDVY